MSGPRTILFICTANVDRSPTAELLYGSTPGIETRSAGIAPNAVCPVDEALMQWAETVMVMEEKHAEALRTRFPRAAARIIVLGVEDRYRRMSPELIATLTERITPHLGAPVRGITPDGRKEEP